VLLLRSAAAVWLKRLSIWAVVLVIAQGILGGLTVKFFLPVWLSSLHGILAQTFFLVTVMIAYGLSIERAASIGNEGDGQLVRIILILTGMVYIQLILGNIMRHSNSGLAIPDFPTMGGKLWPAMNQQMLDHINAWRFENNLDPVKMGQIHIHLTHRVWAMLIFLKLLYLNHVVYHKHLNKPRVIKTLFILNLVIAFEIILGISTVLSGKEVLTTTLHVTTGALVLGLCFLLLLRAAPAQWGAFKQVLKQR